MEENLVIQEKDIKNKTFEIRGVKIMLDVDLATFYGYETKDFNRKLKSKINRFPSEKYMFELTKEEMMDVIQKNPRLDTLKHSTTTPKAFTQFGILMLASALNSPVAVKISLQLVDVFFAYQNKISKVEQMELDLQNVKLVINKLLEELSSVKKFNSNAEQRFQMLFELVNHVTDKKDDSKNKIGFKLD